MRDQNVGFIMLLKWPLLTWNTQVLWLLQPPWHKLSIRLFHSNSLASLCHLCFYECWESWLWTSQRDHSALLCLFLLTITSSLEMRWSDSQSFENTICMLYRSNMTHPVSIQCYNHTGKMWNGACIWWNVALVMPCLHESNYIIYIMWKYSYAHSAVQSISANCVGQSGNLRWCHPLVCEGPYLSLWLWLIWCCHLILCSCVCGARRNSIWIKGQSWKRNIDITYALNLCSQPWAN